MMNSVQGLFREKIDDFDEDNDEDFEEQDKQVEMVGGDGEEGRRG